MICLGASCLVGLLVFVLLLGCCLLFFVGSSRVDLVRLALWRARYLVLSLDLDHAVRLWLGAVHLLPC